MSANDKPVIARLASCNIGKYFNLFSYFVISKINLQKYEKLGKYWSYCARHRDN